MNSEGKRVLLLVGSPKAPGKSVSEALGAYVVEKLGTRGWSSETIFIRMSLQSDEGRAALLEAVKTADLIILSFPLYVDSLPAPVIRAMELIAERRLDKKTRLAVIANCGFPEAQHNNVAMDICQRFAHASGLEWAGGLALGMGGAVSSQRLKEQGGMVGKIIKSLDLTVDAFVNNKSMPDEA
ncbi:MAG: NAD(P)H-dependent oxidoreductase, partial [Candidatus Bipolaricaulota bacterium]|nr:NAD(P)H-dependent oxidoreductase [Candidatus Bipolaricaulota bacterium]